jgi:cyanate lyase
MGGETCWVKNNKKSNVLFHVGVTNVVIYRFFNLLFIYGSGIIAVKNHQKESLTHLLPGI